MREPLDNLKISGIFGSSSKSRTCYSTTKNLVAYAASGGVVVARLDLGAQRVSEQRFFCASSKSHRQEVFSTASLSKDQYGLIKPEQSIVIKGDTWNDADENSDKTVTIGSDLSPARCSPSKIKDRIKDISCLCLSNDGKFLIVGETGHQPRILLYSMAPDSNDYPVFVIHQHSYGISQLQFHPEDSTIFTSLGLINDGFLHIWKLSSHGVRLIASNKNSTIVLGLNWYKDSALVTYGVRQIKVWKFENPNNAANSKLAISRTRTAIKGKNIVLGSLIESTFIDCEHLRGDQLLFLTDSYQIVLYQNGSLISFFQLDSNKQYDNILVDWDNDKLWLSYDESVDSIPLTHILNHQERLRPATGSLNSRSSSPIKSKLFDTKLTEPETSPRDKQRILMMSLLHDNVLLYCTSKGEISVITEGGINQISNPSLNDINVFKKIDQNLAVISSKKGDVKLFNGLELSKYEIELPDLPLSEEITALDLSLTDNRLVVGDSTGKLLIYKENECEYQENIHSSAINDVHIFESIFERDQIKVVITVSRDRTMNFIQLVDGEWCVCETIKDNKGNIIQLEISDNQIYTISSDRTVSCYRLDIVDHMINVSKENILSVKNSPLKLQLTNSDIVVSRSDKSIQIFERDNTSSPRVLRLLDDQGDGILVNQFYVNNEKDQIICSSSLDKAIRCYSFVTGKCLNQYYAHADPVIGMTTVANKFVTVTGNGCLFSWEMKTKEDIAETATTAENLDLVSSAFTEMTVSAPSTPVKSPKGISPVKLTHPTPSYSPIRKESPVSSSPRRGIIPANQLITSKVDSQNILNTLRQLRRLLANSENVENIDEIRKEVSVIHALLEPQETLLQDFGDKLLQLVEAKLRN